MTCRKTSSDEVEIDFNKSQRWWDIELSYDGTPSWVMAVGDTTQEELTPSASARKPETPAVIVRFCHSKANVRVSHQPLPQPQAIGI